MSNETNELATGSKEVRSANEASASQISKSLHVTAGDSTHTFEILPADDLDGTAKKLIWNMFETNMRAMYTASSFGWDPPHKKGELFDPLSRFILVYPSADKSTLVGFTTFRFEFEEGQNILYCYDLQVSQSSQRHGLGRTLMNHLAKIGADFGMEKIMLTVFKANKRALKFYDNFGFEMDPGSPDDADEEDYKLLCKACR
ncbi:acyl-CoA N-acyltransferase [Mycena maculata]|uniref:N-alpha-acetyltransferase 40 n=1 Tax=Mycena maculata TaxID=230809 RepID=A0AAD7KG21_9AGAR|nr:acyl-CoA N-acyltransferase [Mycena maculata]